MRNIHRRLSLISLLACGLASGACAGHGPLGKADVGSRVGEFAGPGGQIIVDADRRTLIVGGVVSTLDDCSTEAVHCFSNAATGFHIAFPRNCGDRSVPDAAGNAPWKFEMISGAPHSHRLDGGYVSTVSNRFGYVYSARLGLFQIRYDNAGQVRFGPADRGSSLNADEAAPFIYRLKQGERFLACSP